MSSTKPTIAFFGATGGCALAALDRALVAGYTCRALARTPSKLTSLLTARSTPTTSLTVIAGNITDLSSVSETLVGSSIIVFSVGGVPKFSPNPLKPTLDQPTICQDGMATVVSALEGMTNKPLLVAVSTTGMDAKRDIPVLMVPLYHWLLEVPHADKKVMEESLLGAAEAGKVGGWAIVKPSLLTDGPAKGEKAVRAGYVGKVKKGDGGWGDAEDVAVGYTISREDVGNFIFEELIQKEGAEWWGKKVSLTY